MFKEMNLLILVGKVGFSCKWAKWPCNVLILNIKLQSIKY